MEPHLGKVTISPVQHPRPGTTANVAPSTVWKLTYDHAARWGLVNTPTAQDAKRIAEYLGKKFPPINIHALFEILVHAFDNVANYGREDGSIARGEVALLESPDGSSFTLSITNRRTAVSLPKTLAGKIFTPADGKISVPKKERDPETGGGAGILFMTQHLPYLHWNGVNCERTSSLRWYESTIKQLPHVTLEIKVPLPTYAEQREFLRSEHRRKLCDRGDKTASKLWAEDTKQKRVPKDFSRGARLVVRALALQIDDWAVKVAAHRADHQNYRHQPNFYNLTRGVAACAHVLKAETKREARGALLKVLQYGDQAEQASLALLAVEPDRGSLNRDIAEAFRSDLSKANRRNSALLALETYASVSKTIDAQILSPLAEEVSRGGALAGRLANFLAASGVLGSYESAIQRGIAALLRKKEAATDPNKAPNVAHNFSEIVEALSCLPTIPTGIELLLVRALAKKELGYSANKLLTERGLSSAGIQALGRTLKEIALKIGDEKADLYYLVQQVEAQGSKVPHVFESACALMRSPNSDNSYSAAEILKKMGLSPAQIRLLVTELNSSVPESAAKGSAISVVGRIAQILEQADSALISGARDGLVKMVLRGVDEYYAARVLAKIGIRAKDRTILETARLSAPEGDNTFYLAEAAKLPIVPE